MARRIVGMIAGLLLAVAAAAPLAAQAGTIRGTVSDSAGDGLANAAVSVEGTTLRGHLGVERRLRDPRRARPARHTMRVRLIGYRAGDRRGDRRRRTTR